MACRIIEKYVPISSKHRPGTKRTGFRGITIHETGNPKKGADAQAHVEYYTRLAKSNSGSYIGYHCFTDDTESILTHPLDEIAWTCGDGNGDGNMKTISIEICVNPEGNFAKARANAAYTAAVIFKKYGIKKVIAVGKDGKSNKAKANLFQHYSWSGKNCPQNIREKGYWDSFVKAVQKELDLLWNPAPAKPVQKEIYRVRKSWKNTASQIGAYSNKTNAIKNCKPGYKVFDSKGNVVYTPAATSSSTKTNNSTAAKPVAKTYKKGDKVVLSNDILYSSASATVGSKKSGTYYLYDGELVNGRYRITNSKANVGKTPMGKYVTGWVNKSSI